MSHDLPQWLGCFVRVVEALTRAPRMEQPRMKTARILLRCFGPLGVGGEHKRVIALINRADLSVSGGGTSVEGSYRPIGK